MTLTKEINMIDNKSVLNNPLIPSGYYYAKVLRIEAEPVPDSKFPKLHIQLRLHPSYGLSEGTIFSSLLFPSPKTYYHYKNFYNTFMLGQFTNEFDKAIGQWGCVQIYPSTVAGVEYSSVRFVYQPMPIRMESWRLDREEINNDPVGDAG